MGARSAAPPATARGRAALIDPAGTHPPRPPRRTSPPRAAPRAPGYRCAAPPAAPPRARPPAPHWPGTARLSHRIPKGLRTALCPRHGPDAQSAAAPPGSPPPTPARPAPAARAAPAARPHPRQPWPTPPQPGTAARSPGTSLQRYPARSPPRLPSRTTPTRLAKSAAAATKDSATDHLARASPLKHLASPDINERVTLLYRVGTGRRVHPSPEDPALLRTEYLAQATMRPRHRLHSNINAHYQRRALPRSHSRPWKRSGRNKLLPPVPTICARRDYTILRPRTMEWPSAGIQ